MTYRTPEQDERLQELYAEWERVQSHGESLDCDVSKRLAEIGAEIEKLTTALDTTDAIKTYAANLTPSGKYFTHTGVLNALAAEEAPEFGSPEWFASVPEIPFDD